MTELYSRKIKEDESITDIFSEFYTSLKGSARLWKEIIKAVEQDVRIDNLNKRKGITSDSRTGIESIAKLINENLDQSTQISPEAFETKDIQDMYSFLKKEVDNVRILKVGKTTPQKLVGAVKMAGRFVGGLFAESLSIVGSSVKFAGELVHITPAAYLLNRLPGLSKIETVAISRGKPIKARKNILEILGDAINDGALFISSKSNAPIFAKAIYNLPEQTQKQIKDASSKLKRSTNTQEFLESISADTIAKVATATVNMGKKPTTGKSR